MPQWKFKSFLTFKSEQNTALVSVDPAESYFTAFKLRFYSTVGVAGKMGIK